MNESINQSINQLVTVRLLIQLKSEDMYAFINLEHCVHQHIILDTMCVGMCAHARGLVSLACHAIHAFCSANLDHNFVYNNIVP